MGGNEYYMMAYDDLEPYRILVSVVFPYLAFGRSGTGLSRRAAKSLLRSARIFVISLLEYPEHTL